MEAKKSTTSMDLPMHQSVMKELMVSIICTSYLAIVLRMNSTIQLKYMNSSLLETLKHVNNMLSQRHDRKT
jgi:hypothetical protein